MKISTLTSIFLSALLVVGLSSVSIAQEAISEDKSAPLVYEVNINTADAEQLASSLQGVGASRAAAIVAYRQEHGAFKSVEDLMLVNGIGSNTLEANRNLLTVGSD
ncbi:MAG: helix-hairpin-helix domain-containing protein [Pseudomonadales bacterium]